MFKLQNIRHARHIKWPIYIMFGFIIVSFIFFYGWNQQNKNSRNPGEGQAFARMRSESLNPLSRWLYLDTAALRASQMAAESEKYSLMPQLPPQLQQMIQQQKVMEKMVTTEDKARTAANSVLLNRAAEKLGVQVSFDDVVAMLKAQPGISDEMLDMQARENGLGDKFGFVEYLRRMQQEQRVKEVKSLVAHASLFELWQEYSLANEKLVLRMAAYPSEAFEKKVTVTQADLEKYLADHKDEFHVPPMRRYAYAAEKRDDLLAKIKPSTEQLKVYYEKNQSQYLEKPATRVAEIYSPLGENQVTTVPLRALNAIRDEAGKAKENDFTSMSEKLRKQYPKTEFFVRNQWIEDESQTASPQILARIKSMNSGTTVVMDNEGVHLVRVLEKRKGLTPTFGTPEYDKIKGRVESDYKEKQADEEFKKEVERFKKEREAMAADKNTTASLRTLAQRLKLKDELTTSVEANSADIPGVGNFTKDQAYVGSLTEGEVSEVLETQAQDTVAVLQVVSDKPGYDPKFAEVKDKVEKAYRKDRSVELAKQAAEQSLNAVNAGADFNKALANAPKPPFDTNEFTRLDSVEALSAPLIGFKQQTLKINTGSTGLSPYGRDEKTPQGYAVWKVAKLITPKQADFEKDRQRFEADYLQVQRETIVREWLADARAKAQYHYYTAEEKKD